MSTIFEVKTKARTDGWPCISDNRFRSCRRLIVSPLGLQIGAKLIAEAENIQEVILDPESTTTDHVITFLNKTLLTTSFPIAPSVHLVMSGWSYNDDQESTINGENKEQQTGPNRVRDGV